MMEQFFSPDTVAVIGASLSPGKTGYTIVNNILSNGFKGTVVPVNPAGGSLLGLEVLPSLRDFSGEIDLVIIALPAEQVLKAAKEAVRKKVRGVVVISAGFSETGKEGRHSEELLREIISSGNAQLLGPNSLGLMNTDNNLNATFAGAMPKAGSIGVFSQSATLCSALLDIAAQRDIGLSKLVSIGNKADISEVDLLKALADDPQTSVIIGYLENIKSGDMFIKAAEDAGNKKPVIILKSGTSEAGRMAAAGHTGVLARAETAYGAAFKRAGVCRADTFTELYDYGTGFASQPLICGRRILIISNAGGPAIIAADAVARAGLEMAVLTADSDTPPILQQNPVTLTPYSDAESYRAAIQAAQQDSNVDGILIILTPQPVTAPRSIAQIIGDTADGSKPVLASFMGGQAVEEGRRVLAAAFIPHYPCPERAVRVFQIMHQYGVWKQRPERMVVRFPVNRRRVERIIRRSQRTNRLQLGEVKSKDILRAYGFHTMQGQLAHTVDEAVEAARFIGFPVAMKIVSPDIIHKTDLGGVKLNLASSREVEDAYELMMLRIRNHVPDAVIESVFVEKMADPGLEVIIGMSRDPQFGPMLMFGLGGIFVEVMKDVTFYLAPITEGEAIQMLKSTRSYQMLQGKRGSKEVDIQTLANALQRISQLTTDFPQILELDINPLIVGTEGGNPVVADARMTFQKREEGG